ncbi:hypothetical protein QBC46DRAFT_300286 [Diplogelasinospora grovesii]|uniref:Uncharacterized protein n=1 Tax=Diplogelasinospora grovesii TaxID=303347 RepID=A0AAN6MWC4_9PEZI|nr:hypothetical protein QBC46DRAFT_300286 [Diplogelasinospora grovesii]
MGLLSFMLGLVIANVSGYCLYHSAQSIPKLRTYEAKAEQAAGWSNVAEKRLRDTRYTVGAGFLATSVSLVCSIYYVLFATTGSFKGILWAAILSAGEWFTSRYMKSFWGDKNKIPLMDDYNDAISDTVKVHDLSDALAVGWGAMAVLRLFGY